MGIFNFLAVPLGYVMRFIYSLVSNYFVAIFLFTLVMRVILFPLSLQSQKKQAERIRLAPRLERLQKKYKNDPKKLQEKQQALYEKEGVSLTGGCLPTIVQMIVLFGIIAVIYKPLTYLSTVPNKVVDAAVSAVSAETYTADDSGYTVSGDTATRTLEDGTQITVDLTTKLPKAQVSGYYGELNMMKVADENHADILREMQTADGCTAEQAEEYFTAVTDMRSEFKFGKYSLLDKPWSDDGFAGISLLWLIPLLSGLTSALVSFISLYYSKMGMSQEKQPGQGCSNGMMMLFMPLFSLYIAFTVPGGVGVYWICSNLIALLQTVVLNLIYNPKKIRAQAELDYEERRRRRAEEKKNKLAEARRRDEEKERAEDEAAARRAEAEKKAPRDKKGKKERELNLEVGELKEDKNEDTNG